MNGNGTTQSFDQRRLRHAVESAPDYPEAAAQAANCLAAKEQADTAYAAASEVVSAIWDREALRLFGEPSRAAPTRPSAVGSHRG